MIQKRNEALLTAVERGHLKRAQMLIDQGADVNTADADGWTPLMWAVATGQKKLVSLLLDKGADVHARDKEGNTALIHAAMAHPEIAERLTKHGADLNAQNKVGTTALMWAVFLDNEGVMNHLIAQGADLNKQNDHGQCALMTAVACGRFDVATTLVQAGANVRLKNKGGFTPLMLASYEPKKQNATFIMLLLSKGANIYARDLIFKRTALDWAVENGAEIAITVLSQELQRRHLNRLRRQSQTR